MRLCTGTSALITLVVRSSSCSVHSMIRWRSSRLMNELSAWATFVYLAVIIFSYNKLQDHLEEN